MPLMTLAEASRETGKSKSTLWRAIKAGRLSATRGDNGEFQIDPAELARAFPPEELSRNAAGKQSERAGDTAGNGATVVLEERIAAKEALIAGKDAVIAELRDRLADVTRQRDKWIEQAEAVRLLAAPPARPRGLIDRLLGRRG